MTEWLNHLAVWQMVTVGVVSGLVLLHLVLGLTWLATQIVFWME